MIWLTRFDSMRLLVNEDHILVVETNHDTVLIMDNGERIRVLESPEEIAGRAVQWRLRTTDLNWLGIEPAGGDGDA